MGNPDVAQGHDINLTKVIIAERTKVYEALTTSSIAEKWWTAPPWKFSKLTLDARPGGKFEYAIENTEDGSAYGTRGEYEEAVPNERLVWTNEEGGGTRVTVTLKDGAGGTELKVHQGSFPDESTRDMHAQGWSVCLDQLASILQN